MLTAHQIFHLQSHIDNIEADSLIPEMVERLRGERGDTLSDYIAHTERVKGRARGILNSLEWPVGLEGVAGIHDFLDEER